MSSFGSLSNNFGFKGNLYRDWRANHDRITILFMVLSLVTKFSTIEELPPKFTTPTKTADRGTIL